MTIRNGLGVLITINFYYNGLLNVSSTACDGARTAPYFAVREKPSPNFSQKYDFAKYESNALRAFSTRVDSIKIFLFWLIIPIVLALEDGRKSLQVSAGMVT